MAKKDTPMPMAKKTALGELDVFQGTLRDGSPCYVPTIPELQSHYAITSYRSSPKPIPYIEKYVHACFNNRLVDFIEGKFFVCADYLLGYPISLEESEHIVFHSLPVATALVTGAWGSPYLVMVAMPTVLILSYFWKMNKPWATMRSLASAVDDAVANAVFKRELAFAIKGLVFLAATVACAVPRVLDLIRDGDWATICCALLLAAGFAKLVDIMTYVTCANAVRTELDVFRESQKLKKAKFEAEDKLATVEKRMEKIRLLPKPSLASKDIIIEHFDRADIINAQLHAENLVLFHRNKFLHKKSKDMETGVRFWKEHAEEMKRSAQRATIIRDENNAFITGLRTQLASVGSAYSLIETAFSAETTRCKAVARERISLLETIDDLRETNLQKDKSIKAYYANWLELLTATRRLQDKINDAEALSELQSKCADGLMDRCSSAQKSIEVLKEENQRLHESVRRLEKDKKLDAEISGMHQRVGDEGVAVLTSVASAKQTEGVVKYLRELETLKKEALVEKQDMKVMFKSLTRQSKDMDSHLSEQKIALYHSDMAIKKKDERIVALEKEAASARRNYDEKLLQVQSRMCEKHNASMDKAWSQEVLHNETIVNLEVQIGALREELDKERLKGMLDNSTPIDDSTVEYEADMSESSSASDSSSQGQTAEDMGWSEVESDGEEAANGRHVKA